MIPAAFVFMDAFPMTVHNKIDLRALPIPTKFMMESDQEYAPPRNQVEEELTAIWSQTLGVEPVGIHDTFYALGGESLLAIQIISQIANQLAVAIPLRSFLEAKTIANLAEYITQVQAEPLPMHYPPLHPAERTDLIPTTGTQESVWFIHQIQPDNLAYNSPAALRLTGPLNIAALERSINVLIKRHESLRTTFAAHDGKPIQVIHLELHITLGTTDLSHIAADSRETEADKLVTTIVQQPFDLTQAPLIRCHLLRLTAEDHILILNIHHAVTDGWSYGVFYRELAECYTAYTTHRQPDLPHLPIQLADYAYWQRAFLQSDTVKKQLDYWKQHLAGSPSLLQLPTDYPRQPIQQLNGSVVRQAISPHSLEMLKRINQEEQTTLFMAFLAVYAILLARTTGQTDILIGSPVVERDQEEVQNLIGFLVNNLVFRINLDATPTYRELLQQVRTTALEAYANRDVPFERIVEALQPERDLSYHPVFQVALAMELEPLAGLQLHNVYGTHLEMNSGGSWFDISVLIEERTSGLVSAWEYDTDLFDESTIRRMAQHFEQLLASAASNPDQPVSLLPMLTEKERSLILTEWNDTQTPYPDTLCIHQLVEQQVQRTPDNIAVIFEDTSLTYRELDERSNQLAHHLQQLGVQPETIVAIAVERSLDMIIGLLGILKAGGAYLPLDPTYPKDRLAFMLDDAEVGILITQHHLRSQLPPPAYHTVCLDTDWQPIATYPTTPPTCQATPDSLVYIIYTSGSTGKPKGALIEHRMLVNMITGLQNVCGINEYDTVLAVTTPAFDIAVEDTFFSLTNGARLVIANQEMMMNGNQLARTIAETNTTWMHATPATWRLLVESGWQGKSDMLIVSGGEALSWEFAQQLLSRCKQLWNSYGPTETTICNTIMHITPDQSRITIGYAMPNQYLYILDNILQPVPIGISGELYIGGACVARGYHNRPELTNERFLQNPFDDDSNNRLYRTGDLARYLADGQIEYLGRTDYQVKIRGFRIELGEIETLLSQHPLVHHALVIVREDSPGNTRLVAYILPQATDKDETTIINTLRHHLETKLPTYMMPSVYMLLDTLPLMPNGKVDRKALPIPDTSRRQVEHVYVPPRTPMEETLVALWQDILGIDQVGIHDNFFHLGGHSLQVMQLVSRIATTLNMPLQVRDIFQYPTIASLREKLEQPPQKEQSSPPAAPKNLTQTGNEDVVCLLTTESLKVEQSPMLTLFATGKIQRVDAAALSYLPPGDLPLSFPEATSPITQEEIIHDWYDNQVVFDESYETHLGSIANISLPLFGNQLYHDKQQTIQRIHESLVLAKFLGARIVALTGLIPSATNFGRDLLPLFAEYPDLPAITTGHATTTSAVVLTIQRLLEESNRTATNECVGFLGLGSIGLATLRLMIAVLPHPRKLLLCDLYSKRQELETIVKELREQGYAGEIAILESTSRVPSPFYEATLIVGATNMPDVLDIDQIAPGTLIVDDSAPHCFNPDQACRRFEQQYDILFTEGGALQTPQPVLATKYYPRRAQQTLPSPYRETFARHSPDTLMGCMFSGLLTTRYPHLSPTTGYIEKDMSVQHYTILQQMQYRGARFHCEQYTLPEPLVAQFRNQYGGDTK
jgi:amino acid adenylation domain-containing protein